MKRLQFLMEDELVRDLDALVDETGLKTRTQLLNTALTLYEWAIKERKAGHVIASVDELTEKYKEIEMPGFPAIQNPGDFQLLCQKLLKLLEEENLKGSEAAMLPPEVSKAIDAYSRRKRAE